MAQVGQKRSWAGDRDDALLAQLRAGVEGSTALEGLVQKNGKAYTLASLSTMVSNLRSKFINTETANQSIDCHMSSLALRKFMHPEAKEEAKEDANEAAKEEAKGDATEASEKDKEGTKKANEAKAVAEFFGIPLAKQIEAQRVDAPGWSKGARDALAALRLLPSNLDTFKLNQEQNTELKRNSTAALELKQKKVITVSTTDLILDEACAVIDSADDCNANMLTLMLALLVVSGRRTAEITNGHSTFTEVLGQAYHAQFTGQLKGRGTVETFTIPLLIPFTKFIKGFEAMRDMQKHEKLPNEEAKRKYQPSVSNALSKKRVLKSLPRGLVPHDLRSIYAAIVLSVFAHGQLSTPGVVERVMGHCSVAQSLHYSSVQLNPPPTKSLGELPAYY
jgi:integrase